MHLWSFTVQESNEACSRTHTTELYNQSEKSLTGVRVGRWKGVSLFLNQASWGGGAKPSTEPCPAQEMGQSIWEGDTLPQFLNAIDLVSGQR